MPVARYALVCLSMLFISPALHGAATVKDGFFTTSDGVRLHYLESGAGPTIRLRSRMDDAGGNLAAAD